jgi:hypothetical protein
MLFALARHALRSFPRKREPNSLVKRRVPAFAGTNGREIVRHAYADNITW